ncbi:MAG: four helix bundle protein [Acidobacteria bacterium]|nr:MAG: four helix bundle protein [Acidobacteriota bacterium]
MKKIERFEDLEIWQEARALAGNIYRASRSGPFARDFGFRDQICRAVVSISSNIAEGFERYSPREFAYFLRIAKASCGEVRSELYLAFDFGYIDEMTLASVLAEAETCARRIGRLRVIMEGQSAKRKTSPSTQHPAPST